MPTPAQTILDTLLRLLNLPDLIVLGLLLAGLILGLRRGFLYTLYGLVGRIIALAAAFFAARTLAPYAARFVVTPIVGQVFEQQALVSRGGALQQAAVETAASMAESVAFLALFLVLALVLGVLAGIAIKSLHFIAHLTPLGLLDALGGGALGILGGVILAALILISIQWVSPITYTALGWLSPERVDSTVLVRLLVDVLPVAI